MDERRSPAKLNRDVQARLGEQLRRMYNDVVSEGVPDRFADLLAKLDKPDSGRSS
ncbi:MAG TPA: NepR family anti-sigma factor [Bauldia sp.]|nr:NepR family anti-sigma factor [Bauldia sp.]